MWAENANACDCVLYDLCIYGKEVCSCVENGSEDERAGDTINEFNVPAIFLTN